jgi:hypothetical protein
MENPFKSINTGKELCKKSDFKIHIGIDFLMLRNPLFNIFSLLNGFKIQKKKIR